MSDFLGGLRLEVRAAWEALASSNITWQAVMIDTTGGHSSGEHIISRNAPGMDIVLQHIMKTSPIYTETEAHKGRKKSSDLAELIRSKSCGLWQFTGQMLTLFLKGRWAESQGKRVFSERSIWRHPQEKVSLTKVRKGLTPKSVQMLENIEAAWENSVVLTCPCNLLMWKQGRKQQLLFPLRISLWILHCLSPASHPHGQLLEHSSKTSW